MDSAPGVKKEVFDGGFAGSSSVYAVADGAFFSWLGNLSAHFERELDRSRDGRKLFLLNVFFHYPISKMIITVVKVKKNT